MEPPGSDPEPADPEPADPDPEMVAGMEGLIAAMRDRRPAPERSEPAEGSGSPAPSSVTTDGVLAAAPWRAVGSAEERDARARDEEPLRGVQQGSLVGRYVVIKKLGAGAMGVVYAAFDPELDRKIALKLLLPGIGGDERREWMLREAQALGRLAHPNIVAIHDVGTLGAQVWIAMEFVQGRTLAAWLAEPRDWRAVVKVMRSAGKGLAAAHAAGLLHRDFKPENVMVADDGRVRVMDFGLARRGPEGVATASERPRPPRAEPLTMQLTADGAAIGTPAYMAPEQHERAEVTAAADQFAFCVSLWEALYGQRPFAGRSLAELATNIVTGRRRTPPKDRRVPSRLRLACERGLSIDPRQRWPSMEALLTELLRLSAPRTRRWLALGVMGGALVLGGGLALARYVEVMDRCTGARAQLEGIWDDTRRRAVEAAVLETGLVFAPSTWERVGPHLDGWADAWAAKHTEVCEATRVTAEQSEAVMELRMGCLREQRAELRAAVKVLSEADAEVVQEAVELVFGLPSAARCDDVERLAEQRQRVPPPEDPQVAREVEELREQLTDLDAEAEAGRGAGALVRVEALVKRAEALGYLPLVAEAELQHGAVLEELARFAEAERALQAAHALALRLDHDDVELEAAQLLTYVVGYQQARPAESLVWGQTAVPLAERRGEGVELATSLSNLGIVLDGMGELDQAELDHRRALRIREALLGADSLGVATVRNNLAGVLKGRGEYEAAELEYRRAMEIYEAALGPDHPSFAMSVGNLGSVLHSEGKYEQAEQHHRRALRIKVKALGPEHPDVATSLNSLGNALQAQGKHARAELCHRRALQIYVAALGPDHPDVATCLTNLANTFAARGQYAQAERHHRRALQILEEALGPDHLDVALAASNLGNACYDRGDLEQAELHLRRALRVREAVLGPDRREVADASNNLAIVLHGRGELEPAERAFQRVLQIREKVLGPEHPDVADVLNNLAVVAFGLGRIREAERHFARVLQIYERTLGPDHQGVAMAANNLGGISYGLGDYEQAELQHRRALRIYEQTLGPEHPEIARTLDNLGNALAAQGRLEQAKQQQEHALHMRERLLGPAHTDVAAGASNLGAVLHAQGDHAGAKLHHQRALRIWEAALGPTHPDLAYALVGLAKVALAERKLDEARAAAERAVAVREASPGAPEELAEARFLLARALWADRSRRPRARALAEQARETYAALDEGRRADLAAVETWLAEHRVGRSPGSHVP